jgi:hypothetical protein
MDTPIHPKLKDIGSQQGVVFARIIDTKEGRTRNDQPYLALTVGDLSENLPARIWADSPAFDLARNLQRGSVVKILGLRSNYQGRDQLEIHRIRPVEDRDQGLWSPDLVHGPGYDRVQDLFTKTLVFDIETVAVTIDIREMPQTIVKGITEVAQRKEWDIEKVLALNPLFSRVASIAVGSGRDDDKDCVLIAPPEKDLERGFPDLPPWVRPMPEKEMLGAFWTLASQADTIVSFNGRGFDLPFLRTRSSILEQPVFIDLLSQPPYQHSPHLDLYLILTGGSRGTAPMNLDAACYAYGIQSPKGAMDGSMVGHAFREKKFDEIAKYNLADVIATRALFQRLKATILDYLD